MCKRVEHALSCIALGYAPQSAIAALLSEPEPDYFKNYSAASASSKLKPDWRHSMGGRTLTADHDLTIAQLTLRVVPLAVAVVAALVSARFCILSQR